MTATRVLLAFLAAIAIGAAPALAAAAVSVDAPGDIALFALGVTGLIIGRRISKRRNQRNDQDHS
jgi:xanthosine utilization system XapX-like protein